MGTFNEQGAMMVFTKLTMPVYNIILGVNPALVGLVLTIMRLWDAVTDPLMGNISDNTRTRWGRRRPYMLIGGVICGLTFPLMWIAPLGWSENTYFLFFLCTGLLFLTANTIFSVPYLSVGLEMTPDYHEKTRVWAYRGFLIPVIVVIVDSVFYFVQSDFFASTQQGLQFFAFGFGGLILITSILPALLVKERFQTERRKQNRVDLFKSLKVMFQYRAFVIIVTVMVLFGIANNTFNVLSIYLKSYYVFGGDIKAGAKLTIYVSAAYQIIHLLSVPGVTYLSSKVGKRHALQVCMILGCIGATSKFFVYNPDYPFLIIAAVFFLAPAMAGFNVLLSSLLSDVCDYDEYKTGYRREGMFASANLWLYKLSFSLSGILSGLLLYFVGFDESLGGNQSDSTLFQMRFWFAAGPAITALASFFLIRSFPISEKKAGEIREHLEKKKAEKDSDENS